MKNKLLIGAHVSIGLGYCNAIKSAISINANSAQIFLKSPRARNAKPLNETDVICTKKIIKENNFFLVGHCSYLLNFAKPISENKWAVNSLIEDLKRISILGGKGVVLHIGKYLKMSREEALKNIYENVKYVLENSPNDVKIFFENTAGQGTEIGFKIEELREIYNLFSNEIQFDRIGFCIDTAHAFAAGYDLRDKKNVELFFKKFDELIGIDKIGVIHFNDSKKDLGTRVDRHQDIGYGFIGKKGLIEVAKFAYNHNIPLILETPSEYLDYEEEIKLIKEEILN